MWCGSGVVGIGNFNLRESNWIIVVCFATVTLIFLPDDLRTWPVYLQIDLRQGFRKLPSDRQTDRHDQIYIPRYFAGGRKVDIEAADTIKYSDTETIDIDIFDISQHH